MVTDVDSAAQAIDVIVQQGEGTKESPLEAVDSQEYAHYYRFAEIHHGKRLIKNPAATDSTPADQQYIYGGTKVPFDASGVYPVPTNPSTSTYPQGSPARRACQSFNYTYTNLLKALHDGFNGNPSQITSAVGLMTSLRQQGTEMMSGGNPQGLNVGPSFEYQPTPPT